MYKKGNATVWIIIILLVVALGWWFFSKDTNVPEPVDTGTPTSTPQATTPPISPIIVVYTDTGFSPSETTIRTGDMVRFVNNSSGQMWVASAMHPTHVVYSGTDLATHCPDLTNSSFDMCAGVAPGTSWDFTFVKPGTWGYHDHLNANNFGKVTVQ